MVSIIENNVLILKIHKDLYSKEVLFHTAYVLLEEFYFFFDVQEDYFVLEIRLKHESGDVVKQLQQSEKIILDELVESAAYLKQLEKTSSIRELLLEKALLTQNSDVSFEDLQKELQKDNAQIYK